MLKKNSFKILYICIFAILNSLSCQTHSPIIQAKSKIFIKGRKLTYRVTRFMPNGHQIKTDTIVIRSYGDYKYGEYDTTTTQIKVGFSYDARSQPIRYAGVIECDSELWSHPPRESDYAILELSPFPHIKLPVILGAKWTWDLGVGSYWGNPKWATWRGEMQVKFTYCVVGKRLVKTKFGQIICWVVQGHGNCQQGSTFLEILYHPQYGFVQLNYRNINGSRMNFALIDFTTEVYNESLPTPNYLLQIH